MDNISDKHLIKKFLRNTLSPYEAKLFASKKELPEFIALLEEEIIAVKNRERLKEKLQDISLASSKISRKKQKKTIISLGIAASLALLITLQFSLFGKMDNQELYNSYYNTYPNIYDQRGTENPSESDFEKAMQFYNSKDYLFAKNQFENIKKKTLLKDNELFYYGITLLELNENSLAEKQFYLIKNNDSFYNEAQWYLALVHIKNNNTKKAKTILKTILESSTTGQKRKNKIIKLLKQLD